MSSDPEPTAVGLLNAAVYTLTIDNAFTVTSPTQKANKLPKPTVLVTPPSAPEAASPVRPSSSVSSTSSSDSSIPEPEAKEVGVEVSEEDKLLLGEDGLDADVADDAFDHHPPTVLLPGCADHGRSVLRGMMAEALEIALIGIPVAGLTKEMEFIVPEEQRGLCFPNLYTKIGTCTFSVLKNKPCSHWHAAFASTLDIQGDISLDQAARFVWQEARSHMPSIPPAILLSSTMMVPDAQPVSMEQKQLPAHAKYRLDKAFLDKYCQNGVAQLLELRPEPERAPSTGGRSAQRVAHKGGWRGETQVRKLKPIAAPAPVVDPYSPLEGVEIPANVGGRKRKKAAYRAQGLAGVFDHCLEQSATLVAQAEKAAVTRAAKAAAKKATTPRPTSKHKAPTTRTLFTKLIARQPIPCKFCWEAGVEDCWFRTVKAYVTHCEARHPEIVDALSH
jgi:hypothetical protein